jgi:hypothetical protein
LQEDSFGLTDQDWKERRLRRKRTVLLSIALVIASFFVLCAQKIFEYAAAPDKDKESDFIFPATTEQKDARVLPADPKPALFSFERRRSVIKKYGNP